MVIQDISQKNDKALTCTVHFILPGEMDGGKALVTIQYLHSKGPCKAAVQQGEKEDKRPINVPYQHSRLLLICMAQFPALPAAGPAITVSL